MGIFTEILGWLADPAHWSGPNGIPARLLEHIAISGISLAIALLIGLPVGIWIGHTGRASTQVINLANLGRAMPSIAIIGIVLPITAAFDPELGFKVYPTIIAMVALAIPPILVTAYTGVAGVDRDLIEAGRGMGMRDGGILRRVELPVAIPVIVVGARSAGVQVVATATLGAIFGFGGLGRYLVDGYAQNDDAQIFAGVVLVAGLAILTEIAFAPVQRLLTSPGIRLERQRTREQDPVRQPPMPTGAP
jgi:osmoprotectant transport system permease protein